MASSSRSVVRAASNALRQAAVPKNVGAVSRSYATEIEIRQSETALPSIPEPSLYGSAAKRNAGQTTMKKYTGPGFPKIPVSQKIILGRIDSQLIKRDFDILYNPIIPIYTPDRLFEI